MDGHCLEAAIDDEAEEEAEAADGHAPGEEGLAADGVVEESGVVEVGYFEAYIAGKGERWKE